jgi:hypothetical protein
MTTERGGIQIARRNPASRGTGGRPEATEPPAIEGEVIADSASPAGLAVVEQRFDATEPSRAKVVTLTALMLRGGVHRPAVPKPS